MPALRQMSATGIPSLPCFKMNAFCASENFDAFIVFRFSQPGTLDAENSSQKRSSLLGADQLGKRGGFIQAQMDALAHVRAKADEIFALEEAADGLFCETIGKLLERLGAGRV